MYAHTVELIYQRESLLKHMLSKFIGIRYKNSYQRFLNVGLGIQLTKALILKNELPGT
jgi:hypothetical protein